MNLVQLEFVAVGEEQEFLPNVGETLMMRRSMIIPEKEEVPKKNFGDSWLCTNIFRTRCTSGGKICQVIIDGGSCENMVAREMVEKLNLQCEKHHHPYHIARFNKGNEVIVDERCLVSFTIGKIYKDEIWYDFIHMESCHILLGRPW